MRHLAWPVLSSMSFLAACGTDAGLFGEATSAASGAGAQGGDGTGATTSSDAGGAGPSSSSAAGASGPGPASSSGPGGSPSSGGSSAGGSGGDGGKQESVGCSDGEREYFLDVAMQPKIAGCDGGFLIPGVTTPESMQPACNGGSGDDSPNPQGADCSAADLCATGWHVCEGAADVAAHSATGGCEPSVSAMQLFYVTRQVQDQIGQCASFPFTNNLTGCGTLGEPTEDSCAPLNIRMRAQECGPTANWYCGNPMTGALNETEIVFKDGSGEGGVLCCKD